MDNKYIINKLIQIYFRDNCSVKEALSKADEELGLKHGETVSLIKNRMEGNNEWKY